MCEAVEGGLVLSLSIVRFSIFTLQEVGSKLVVLVSNLSCSSNVGKVRLLGHFPG